MSADDIDRCGIFPFSNDSDEYKSLCAWHDQMYLLKESGQQPLSRKEVDKRFLTAMLIYAGDSLALKARAYLYYGIARLAGGPFWKWL